ncbi:CaiB/BaiF CoA transferase family protein [Streptomyces sp. NPDC056390]|uniref:CaiB/BaiF CoA transferase family protein n=1 Tax=Streptomyces sp. NPDC056390 TaxID=3345806 RepID=UPI0035D68D1A
MTTTQQERDGRSLPLTGLKIVDLSHFLAGPFATMILGDLGADVLKIEPPSGDPVRKLPPHEIAGNSTFFFSVNRNKRSKTIDLKSPAGRQQFLEIVAEADVVCHNFRPGVMERLGLGYDELLKHRSDLVLCSLYGFDSEGPWAGYPAVDSLLQALSGVMDLTGEPDGPPARVGYQIGDTAGGLWAAIAILAGLHGRNTDGEGRHVEVSLFDAQLSLLVWQAQDYLTHDIVYERMGTRHVTFPPSQAFECADGRYVYATPSAIPRWWTGYCRALDRPEIADDPRFHDLAARQQNRAELEQLVASAFKERPSGEWVERFRAQDVPVALVQNVAEAFSLPTVARRNMVVPVELSDGSTARMVGNPIKTGARERFTAPPRLGQHNDAPNFLPSPSRPTEHTA